MARPVPEGFAQETAGPPVKDAIFARKILMGAIDMNMDEIETALAAGGKFNLADAREHADTISIMLMAFPHMFPAETNQWKPGADRDPATDTYASPELWARFADFYGRAGAASQIAYAASRAENAADFRGFVAKLRAACNSCHDAYQKKD
jgi:cytochrome c556